MLQQASQAEYALIDQRASVSIYMCCKCSSILCRILTIYHKQSTQTLDHGISDPAKDPVLRRVLLVFGPGKIATNTT